MLDRTHRFHGYNALNFAYKNGRTARGPLLNLKYAVNPRRQTYRVAVVVGKKVSKSAVTRNRIRRRVYEAVRLQAPRIQGAYDLIFVGFGDELASIEFDKLQKSIRRQLEGAGIITANGDKHAIVGTEGKKS